MNFNISHDQNKIAVAVSGGGDSMALAHMLSMWAQENDRLVHILHVNHNLRNAANKEAVELKNWVKDFPNTKYFILNWKFVDKPNTAVMEKARSARYALMAEHCAKHNIKTLAVGHHADDQLETFLFRLAKGSGLDGLTGMNEWGAFENIKLYRPLLGFSHDELIKYCINNNLNWFDDPSNEDIRYARPRLRLALSEEGLDAKRFTKTLERLGRGKQALNQITNEAISKYYVNGVIEWDAIQNYPIDIQIRVLQNALEKIGNTESGYPPKLERIEEIVKLLRPHKSATLHGCVLTMSGDGNRLEIIASKA